MSDDIDADRERPPREHHEASEISYDEQFYPARPRRLRPRARLRLFPRLIGGAQRATRTAATRRT